MNLFLTTEQNKIMNKLHNVIHEYRNLKIYNSYSQYCSECVNIFNKHLLNINVKALRRIQELPGIDYEELLLFVAGVCEYSIQTQEMAEFFESLLERLIDNTDYSH